MKAQSLVNKVKKLGGTAEITIRKRGEGLYDIVEVIGELNDYDIHMFDYQSGFYTSRHKSKRNYNDIGSDYNPGGYRFHRKLKELEELHG